MKRTDALALAALIATTGASSGPPVETATDAMAVLRAAMDAPSRLSYEAQVSVLHFGSQKSVAAIFRVEHRAPNLTRRWYLAPQGLYGDSIISRGDTTFSIDVKRERVVVAHDDAVDDQVAEDDNFGILQANYRASFAPGETLDGRPARVILLTNKYTGQTTMRVHVDARTGLVLEKETYAANGSLLGEMRIEKLRYTDAIPTQVFEIPKDYPRVNGPARSLPSSDLSRIIASAGFKALNPKYLPDGFTPVEGDLISIKGVRTLHLLYSDGIRTVSLFESEQGASVDMSRYHVSELKTEDVEAQYVEEGPTTLFTWSKNGLHFTMVGEISLGELERIAKSVVP
jgi:negative regulator of sigma E activity